MRLDKLPVDQLLDLRASIDNQLEKRQAHIRSSLEKLQSVRPSKRRPSPLLGSKVPPKYRGPNGETWAGRGAVPRWLRALAGQSSRKMKKFRVT
jgi:DNA-binding protein H-NS